MRISIRTTCVSPTLADVRHRLGCKVASRLSVLGLVATLGERCTRLVTRWDCGTSKVGRTGTYSSPSTGSISRMGRPLSSISTLPTVTISECTTTDRLCITRETRSQRTDRTPSLRQIPTRRLASATASPPVTLRVSAISTLPRAGGPESATTGVRSAGSSLSGHQSPPLPGNPVSSISSSAVTTVVSTPPGGHRDRTGRASTTIGARSADSFLPVPGLPPSPERLTTLISSSPGMTGGCTPPGGSTGWIGPASMTTGARSADSFLPAHLSPGSHVPATTWISSSLATTGGCTPPGGSTGWIGPASMTTGARSADSFLPAHPSPPWHVQQTILISSSPGMMDESIHPGGSTGWIGPASMTTGARSADSFLPAHPSPPWHVQQTIL